MNYKTENANGRDKDKLELLEHLDYCREFVESLDERERTMYQKAYLHYVTALGELKQRILERWVQEKGRDFIDGLYMFSNFLAYEFGKKQDKAKIAVAIKTAYEFSAILDEIEQADTSQPDEQTADTSQPDGQQTAPMAGDEPKAEKGAKASITDGNAQLLADLFKPSFKGLGRNENYFETHFLPQLKTICYTAKNWARLAFLVYNSKQIHPTKNFKAFTDFSRCFSELLGLPDNVARKMAGYKPKDLKGDDAHQVQSLFYYFEMPQ